MLEKEKKKPFLVTRYAIILIKNDKQTRKFVRKKREKKVYTQWKLKSKIL